MDDQCSYPSREKPRRRVERDPFELYAGPTTANLYTDWVISAE